MKPKSKRSEAIMNGKKAKKMGEAMDMLLPKKSIHTVRTSEMKDRFFLEEIIFRLEHQQTDYAKNLLYDWMKEKVQQIPLTEKKRKELAVEMQGGDWQNFYFKSEQDLHEQIDF